MIISHESREPPSDGSDSRHGTIPGGAGEMRFANLDPPLDVADKKL